jgi:hypothetical protein
VDAYCSAGGTIADRGSCVPGRAFSFLRMMGGLLLCACFRNLSIVVVGKRMGIYVRGCWEMLVRYLVFAYIYLSGACCCKTYDTWSCFLIARVSCRWVSFSERGDVLHVLMFVEENWRPSGLLVPTSRVLGYITTQHHRNIVYNHEPSATDTVAENYHFHSTPASTIARFHHQSAILS